MTKFDHSSDSLHDRDMVRGQAEWTKKEWRIAARSARDKVSLTDSQYDEATDHLIADILKPMKKEPLIAVYWPIGNEFDTKRLLETLAQRHIKTALPRVSIDGNGLYFHKWQWGEPLENSKFSLSEPYNDISTLCSPNIIIMPLLAFDDTGTRLGYGAGHYDRTLEGHDVFKIGIAFDEQKTDIPLPSFEHDIKMDAILTPSGLLRFN